jgi:hypothetical protein
MEGEIARKGVSFFLHAARDAGVAISPFLTKARPLAAREVGAASGASMPRSSKFANESDTAAAGTPSSIVLAEKLLQRLPEFDPTWSDELKSTWLSAFLELIPRTRGNENTD